VKKKQKYTRGNLTKNENCANCKFEKKTKLSKLGISEKLKIQSKCIFRKKANLSRLGI
jgi:hypothetical protein